MNEIETPVADEPEIEIDVPAEPDQLDVADAPADQATREDADAAAAAGTNVVLGQFGTIPPNPVADLGGVQTTGAWTCAKCGEFCNPNVYASNIPPAHCWKCNAPKATEIPASSVAEDHHPQQAENVERQANALPPLPIRGTGKNFDVDGAFQDLHTLSYEVDANVREHDELKKKTASAAERVKDSQRRFKAMFDHYFAQKEKVDTAPTLPLEPEVRGCGVSRALQAPCPACQSARALFGDKDAPKDDPMHPDHPQHEELAKSLLIKDRDELAAALRVKGFFIQSIELQVLPIDELDTLRRFAAQTGPIPPQLIADWAHIAAAAGSDRQECKRCGLTLWSSVMEDAPYVTNAVIGLDCDGESTGETAAEAAARIDAEEIAEGDDAIEPVEPVEPVADDDQAGEVAAPVAAEPAAEDASHHNNKPKKSRKKK